MLKPIIISALLLFSYGHAQVDDAAKIILDYADAKAAEATEAAPLPENIETMLFTMDMQLENPFQGNLETVAAIDVANERISSTTSLVYEDPHFDLQTHIIYDKGYLAGTSTSLLGDGNEEMIFDDASKAALSEQLEAMFTMMNEPIIPEYTYARYMGRRAYGEVLDGVQVNIASDDALANLPGMAELADSEIGVIFNGKLESIGMVMNVSGETFLTVYDEPGLVPSTNKPLKMTQYLFDKASDSTTLQAVVQMSYTSFNEPLDPDLFELPQVSASN